MNRKWLTIGIVVILLIALFIALKSNRTADTETVIPENNSMRREGIPSELPKQIPETTPRNSPEESVK